MPSHQWPAHLLEDIYYFNHGLHQRADRFLGAKKRQLNGQDGFQFSVWAPHAFQVYLQGDFSSWANLAMDQVPGGVWTLFVSGAELNQCYKYGIDHGDGVIEYKIDPFAQKFEIPPKDASMVWDLQAYDWQDASWLAKRKQQAKYQIPLQIYEVHLTSWRRHPDGSTYSFRELADSLIPYVKEMGYSHIELMPVMDHPLEASWGYQITGYYAVAGRYGSPEELKAFIDQAHQNGIGVILDWVPGHFNRNAYGLSYYDGSPTYEYADYGRANNQGWGTLNFDLGKHPVQSFLMSNLFYWIEEFHIDGIRVDAVTNMIDLDFDQAKDERPSKERREDPQGVAFLQKMNQAIHQSHPDIYMIAEESTDRPGITHPVEAGGLGFDYKWNMGWMNDTLRFFQLDPLYRPSSLRLITFVFMYQYKERYILPLSHDEVVHGKRSLLGKLPGNRFDQFANLRLLHAYMLAQPGKTLHFMGHELGQFLEWRYYEELDWAGLAREYNQPYQDFIKDLNKIGLTCPEFYQLDHDPSGLEIIDADDLEMGVLSFFRRGQDPDSGCLVILNFTPVDHFAKRIGVPLAGRYQVLLNSQDQVYGGKLQDYSHHYDTEAIAMNGQSQSILIDVPGLSAVFVRLKKNLRKGEEYLS